jgi:hypothetical protein
VNMGSTPVAITARSNRSEELKTRVLNRWHRRVNTDYRRGQPPVNDSRQRLAILAPHRPKSGRR